MQPSMNKVHSLDYSTPASVAASNRKHTPLMHSVSIVVELAHELEPVASDADTCWRKEPDEAQEDGEEEDEEEAEDECLAGGLARRVVIVDEADKIERVRARSAEPEVSLATGRCVPLVAAAAAAGGVVEQVSTSGCGRVGSRWSSAGGAASTAARKQSSGCCELAEHGELSQLGGMRRNTCHQLARHQVDGKCDAASTEEAGSGQPQQALRGPNVAGRRHARSGSAQLDSRSAADLLRHVPTNQSAVEGPQAALGGAGAVLVAAGGSQCPLRNRCHQQQRRRSLQISFLSGGGGGAKCGSTPGNQLLTDEEVRGERQFNEHLRSLRSSADWTAASQHWSSLCLQHHHQQASEDQRRQQQQQQFQQRCKSVEAQPPQTSRSPEQEGPHCRASAVWQAAGQRKLFASPLSPPLSTGSTSTGAPQQQQQQQYTRRHSPRRVSFCSGEPLEAANLSGGRKHLQADTCTLKRHSVVVGGGSADSDRCARSSARWLAPESGREQLGEEQELFPAETSGSGGPVAAPMEREKHATSPGHQSRPGAAGGGGGGGGGGQEVGSPSKSDKSLPATATTSSASGSSSSNSSRKKEEEQVAGSGTSTATESSRLQSIMANARQRQEEFARLLEEHEQIVNEINRVETKISNSQQAATQTVPVPVPVPVPVGATRPVGAPVEAAGGQLPGGFH